MPTILVAEDNESNYLLVSYILQSHYDVLHAADGLDALKIYEERHPDLILMDIRMPRLGGLAAAEQIRRKDYTTPIVAVTAFAYDSDREAALKAGCDEVVTKPIDATKLLEVIDRQLNK